MTTGKDICIGEGRWIKWIDFDPGGDNEILEVDELLRPTFDFWNGLETQCVAACCGIDAYAFREDDIRQAIKSMDKTELIRDLIHIREEIVKSNRQVLMSGKLNNLFVKTVFLQLVDHILTVVNSVNFE